MEIVVLTVSDRASRGEYEDLGGPHVEAWLKSTITTPFAVRRQIIPDGVESVSDTLVQLCDRDEVDLVLTTGGTGPAPRDETPEAMNIVLAKELRGFGELMRKVSLEQTPTAILSRQTAGTRGKTLIINLPGNPRAIDVCLNAVFAAVPYCLDLIGAGRIETDPVKIKSYRPSK